MLFSGPTPGGFYPERVDAFDTMNHLLTSVPTCRPEVAVVIENNSKEDMTCTAWVYGIRHVP